MNVIRQIATAVVAVTLLVGCASVPPAPSSLEQKAKEFIPSFGKARIYLFRERNIFGAAIQFQVALDGRIAGGTGPGTFFMFEVPPGKHVVSSSTAESVSALEINAEPDRNYFIRQRQNLGVVGPRVELVRVDETEGRKAVSSYRMLESPF